LCRLVDGRGHAAGARQFALYAARALRLGPRRGREAGHGLEYAVQVERAHAGALRELGERRCTLGTVDQPAQPGDERRVRVGRQRSLGMAAPAGPEARALGTAALAWKATFSGRGLRAPQDGRQNTPVLRTE
jgi:hypothetical protein